MTFQDLLKHCAGKAYPEPRSPIHDQIGQQAVHWVSGILPPKAKVLDVGCGSAFCSEMFKTLGHEPTAISVLPQEVKHAQSLGIKAFELEMHELGKLLGQFDLIWLRHVAEHSPCPLLLLHECHESAVPGGLLYLEVPLPWTAAVHELNPDHYSVLNVIAWESLLRRVGWIPISQNTWPMITQAGPDCYHSFICKRAELEK